MSLFTRIRDYFCPPKLRNRAGGMAFVRIPDEGTGEADMNGHIVQTKSANAAGFWLVDPPQFYRARCYVVDHAGVTVDPGTKVYCRIHDRCLQPINDPDPRARSQEADFQPKVPTSGPRKVAA